MWRPLGIVACTWAAASELQAHLEDANASLKLCFK
jgi:hypothetical protein